MGVANNRGKAVAVGALTLGGVVFVEYELFEELGEVGGGSDLLDAIGSFIDPFGGEAAADSVDVDGGTIDPLEADDDWLQDCDELDIAGDLFDDVGGDFVEEAADC